MRHALDISYKHAKNSCAIAAGKALCKLLQLYAGGDYMQEIIEKIYRGELYPAEQIEPMLQNFKAKWAKSSSDVEVFSSQLPDELKPLFESVLAGKLEISVLEGKQAFVDGFKLGAKLLVEVFAEVPVPEKE